MDNKKKQTRTNRWSAETQCKQDFLYDNALQLKLITLEMQYIKLLQTNKDMQLSVPQITRAICLPIVYSHIQSVSLVKKQSLVFDTVYSLWQYLYVL